MSDSDYEPGYYEESEGYYYSDGDDYDSEGHSNYEGSDMEDNSDKGLLEDDESTKEFNRPNDYGRNSGGSNNSIAPRQELQSNNYQWTARDSIVDKNTGSYAKRTEKKSYSSGDVFKERSTGRVGYKDEYKTTDTFKVGNKSGFSEYQVEKRYRLVDYGNSSSSSSSSSKGKSSNSSGGKSGSKYLK